MQEKIGNFVYADSFSRIKLTDYIERMLNKDSNYNVGVHATRWGDKRSTIDSISQEGIKITSGLSMYSTIRFLGYGNNVDKSISEYGHDLTDNIEMIVVVAIPKTFIHSSGKKIEGGVFFNKRLVEAKEYTKEYTEYKNLTDETFDIVPKEFILGCYIFDKNNDKVITKTKPTTIPQYNQISGYWEYGVVYEQYNEVLFGECQFYANPYHYDKLPQIEKDSFIEENFSIELLLQDSNVNSDPLQKTSNTVSQFGFKVISRTDAATQSDFEVISRTDAATRFDFGNSDNSNSKNQTRTIPRRR